MSDILLIDRPAPGLVVATLNRPDALNALSRAMREALVDLFTSLDGETDGRVVILTGSGRAFCAGLDLAELSKDTSGLDFDARHDPATAIRNFRGIVIGAINGVAITGGFELALACDVLLAGESARFADTHARVGLLPGWGLSQLVPRTIGIYRAKQLSLTGDFLPAARAAEWGLVGSVMPDAELMTEARRVADAILDADPATVRELKHMIDKGYSGTHADGMAFERSYSTARNTTITPEDIAAIRARVQTRGRAQTRSN